MNKCVECGKKNKNHAEFCKECGAELPKKLSKEEKSQIRFEKCKEKYGHLLTISKACIFLSIAQRIPVATYSYDASGLTAEFPCNVPGSIW